MSPARAHFQTADIFNAVGPVYPPPSPYAHYAALRLAAPTPVRLAAQLPPPSAWPPQRCPPTGGLPVTGAHRHRHRHAAGTAHRRSARRRRPPPLSPGQRHSSRRGIILDLCNANESVIN
jgi:hypothetical protein